MKLISKGVVHATPKKLNANYTIENVEDSFGVINNRGTEYVEVALDFLKYGYNLKFYVSEFGGQQCWQPVKKKYRPVYTLNLKHKAWFIELFGED